jgi:hypothetical protein
MVATQIQIAQEWNWQSHWVVEWHGTEVATVHYNQVVGTLVHVYIMKLHERLGVELHSFFTLALDWLEGSTSCCSCSTAEKRASIFLEWDATLDHDSFVVQLVAHYTSYTIWVPIALLCVLCACEVTAILTLTVIADSGYIVIRVHVILSHWKEVMCFSSIPFHA